MATPPPSGEAYGRRLATEGKERGLRSVSRNLSGDELHCTWPFSSALILFTLKGLYASFHRHDYDRLYAVRLAMFSLLPLVRRSAQDLIPHLSWPPVVYRRCHAQAT